MSSKNVAPTWSELGELLTRASAGWARLGDRALKPLRLTTSLMRVLTALDRDRGARVADLVSSLQHDQAAVSRLVAKLEAAGMLRRVPVPGDARAARLLLTERGQQAGRAGRRRLEAVQQRLAGSFSAAERRALPALLERLATKAG